MATTTNATVRTNARNRRTVKAATVSRARKAITIVMGCGIPAVSLYTSHRAGELLTVGAYVGGLMFLSVCLTVLALSLSHLATAIGDITRSNVRDSWLLAVALDAGIVVCELTKAMGHDGGWLAMLFLVGITGASMLLNCWAFLSHAKPTSKRSAK